MFDRERGSDNIVMCRCLVTMDVPIDLKRKKERKKERKKSFIEVVNRKDEDHEQSMVFCHLLEENLDSNRSEQHN